MEPYVKIHAFFLYATLQYATPVGNWQQIKGTLMQI